MHTHSELSANIKAPIGGSEDELSTEVASTERLSIAAFSLRGSAHVENQDSFLLSPELGLFAVADGVSGHDEGAAASRIAIATAIGFLQARLGAEWALQPMPRAAVTYMLGEAIRAAHLALLRRGERNNIRMGTTLDLVALSGKQAFIGHVGDGRVCRLRNGRLSTLTRDHTLAQELAELAACSVESLNPKLRRTLSRAVGVGESVTPDVFAVDWQPGDRLLLCSDGVHDEVSAEELRALMEGHAATAAWSLLYRVRDRAESDDATAVLIAKRT